MPDKKMMQRARMTARAGKSPSTQAGVFVHKEIEHVRAGKHGARSAKQAIAIGLSKARRAGVKLPPPKKGQASSGVRMQAMRDIATGSVSHKPSRTRSRAALGALKREGHMSASTRALSRQAHSSAQRRGGAARRRAAMKAVHTKGKIGMQRAARKAVRTRYAGR
jgi:hypothetical protein